MSAVKKQWVKVREEMNPARVLIQLVRTTTADCLPVRRPHYSAASPLGLTTYQRTGQTYNTRSRWQQGSCHRHVRRSGVCWLRSGATYSGGLVLL